MLFVLLFGIIGYFLGIVVVQSNRDSNIWEYLGEKVAASIIALSLAALGGGIGLGIAVGADHLWPVQQEEKVAEWPIAGLYADNETDAKVFLGRITHPDHASVVLAYDFYLYVGRRLDYRVAFAPLTSVYEIDGSEGTYRRFRTENGVRPFAISLSPPGDRYELVVPRGTIQHGSMQRWMAPKEET